MMYTVVVMLVAMVVALCTTAAATDHYATTVQCIRLAIKPTKNSAEYPAPLMATCVLPRGGTIQQGTLTHIGSSGTAKKIAMAASDQQHCWKTTDKQAKKETTWQSCYETIVNEAWPCKWLHGDTQPTFLKSIPTYTDLSSKLDTLSENAHAICKTEQVNDIE